jgi:phospholipid transport system substrate-binding protein
MTGSSVLAQEQSPHELMTSVATNLFSRLSAQQERLQNEPALVNQIVEEELMPYVDYRYAAFKILGKNLRSTSKQEREDFAIAMQDYLTVIYVNALRQYKNQTVSFQAPVKKHRGKIAVVKALISDTGAPDISIDFKLRQDKNTREWKAFDMVVEGISMLNAKQAEINARISASSLEQVTEELESLSAE